MTHNPEADAAEKTLEERISVLETENRKLKKRVSELELQVAQITERVLMNRSSCSSCGR
ncbi:MAG: hypothetical protein Q4Q20_05405 [Methanocorpusculum sp.]|nr:hypothetical protein [Methanocorpusculum sp.]